MKLPNGERAIVDRRKLEEYCLNPNHPRGRNKARVFASVGIGQQAASEDLFISVISTGEIAKGIGLLKESSKKHALSTWLQALERDYADRVLVIDLERATYGAS